MTQNRKSGSVCVAILVELKYQMNGYLYFVKHTQIGRQTAHGCGTLQTSFAIMQISYLASRGIGESSEQWRLRLSGSLAETLKRALQAQCNTHTTAIGVPWLQFSQHPLNPPLHPRSQNDANLLHKTVGFYQECDATRYIYKTYPSTYRVCGTFNKQLKRRHTTEM